MSAADQDPDCHMLEAIGFGIYRIDDSGLCTYANQAALAMLGYAAGEVMGRNMHDLIHHSLPGGAPIAQRDCPLICSTTERRAVRLSSEVLWRKDGSFFTAEYSAWPLPGTDAESVVTFVDVSTRGEWQQGLSLQSTVAQVLGGTGSRPAVLTDVIAAIAGATNLSGGVFWAVEERGLRVSAQWWADPEAARALDDHLVALRPERGEGAAGEAWDSGHPIRREAGPSASSGIGNEPLFGYAIAFPVTEDDQVRGVLELFADRPDRLGGAAFEAVMVVCRLVGQFLSRRAVEEELRGNQSRSSRREEEFRTLADNIPQLAWMADPTGNIYWYNQRWYDYTGTTAVQMLGDGWRSVHDATLVDAAAGKFASSIAAGTEWEDVFPLRSAAGDYRWFLSRAIPVRDDYGNIARWFGTNTDITDQRRIEKTLADAKLDAEAANAAKSQFLANMSHELRTPLNAVIGYSEMLREDAEDMGATGMLPDLDRIHRAGRTLLSLVNDVLDLSKIEAGKMDMFLEDFEVAEAVEDVVTTVRPLIAKANNRLDVSIAPDVGVIHADLTKLRQILLNLLGNATKFTGDGVVSLVIAREAADGRDTISFAIKDTGIGMTAEQIGRLFKAFSQADQSTTRNYGGTGLGLALSRKLAQMMGGDIAVASSMGEGSTFTLVLPVTGAQAAAEPAKEADAGHPVALAADDGRPLVLVVDDDPVIRDQLGRLLAKEGLRGAFAANGEEGLALARTLKPAAITLDVMMPSIDGWHVLTRLKADAQTCAIPVVMLSMVDDRSLGLALGASDYLLKPIDRDRLVSVLHDQIGDVAGSVLVVDDDPSTRELLRRTLESAGYQVREAENGRRALEAVRQERPALILSDILMPEMNGFEFIHALRDLPEAASVPVIVITSKDLSAEERAQLTGGVETVIRKGALDRDALLKRVTDRLAGVAHGDRDRERKAGPIAPAGNERAPG